MLLFSLPYTDYTHGIDVVHVDSFIKRKDLDVVDICPTLFYETPGLPAGRAQPGLMKQLIGRDSLFKGQPRLY